MPPRIDSVNMSVSKEPAPVSKFKKEVTGVSMSAKKTPLAKNRIKSSKQKRSFISVVLPVFVAVVVVGGGIYVIQGKINSKYINEAKQQAENIKNESQNKLDQLNSLLSNFQNENSDLKSKTEKMKNILGVSKAEYNNAELGLSFVYPASYGQVNINKTSGEAGQKIFGTFSDFSGLVFGGITSSYSSLTNGDLTDTQGFKKKAGKYYFKSGGQDPALYEVDPVKVLTLDNTEIPIIDKEENLLSTASSTPIASSEANKLLALVNLENLQFNGLAFIDNDTEQLSLGDFENILNSIVISEIASTSNQTILPQE